MKPTTLHRLTLEVRNAASPDIERRGNLPGTGLEYRAAKDGKPAEVSGYAAIWGSVATELRWMTEEIRKGAFTKSLANEKRDQVALAHHDWSKPLARRSAGTLTLIEDDKGLRVSFPIPDTTDGRDIAENIRNGNIKGFSFGMIVTTTEWRFAQAEGERDHRTVVEADLYEISPVTMPAYDATSAEVAERSLTEAKKKAAPAPTGPNAATLRRRAEALALALPEAC